MPAQLAAAPRPASRTVAADVIVRRLPEALVVSPTSGAPPLALAAVLIALGDCPPDRPVVLDLSELLPTTSALDIVHLGLCGPLALTSRVTLVAKPEVTRRRLQRFAVCGGIPVHASVAEATGG